MNWHLKMNSIICEYCQMPTGRQIGTKEIQVFLCEKCELLLKDPDCAMRLLRGHLSMKLRGTDSEEALTELIENGLQELKKLKTD